MMNGHQSASSLVSPYTAFTEEASDQGSKTFTAGQRYLGELSGLSAKTVQRLEQRLEEFRLVEITRPNLPGYHTYSLLSLRLDDTTSGQGDLTLGHYTFLNIRP
jgi:hypothetical protein